MASFSWLHLTDLHFGMDAQEGLWPRFKQKWLDDLEDLQAECGPWDLVLFTGDLTQRGTTGEFERIDELLHQLWDRLSTFGAPPALLAVPGNHDLVRPPEDKPEALLLQEWPERSDVQAAFWKNTGSPYRKLVSGSFKNYVQWWNRQPFRPSKVHSGMLPGDFSATIEKNGASVGILGLNSTFLQLTAGNYERRLALKVSQFHKACEGGNGPEWVQKHHLCVLLTHQPPGWLTPEAEADLNNEIAEPGQFALHLFGHMHESLYTVIGQGGGEARRLWQGRSLFGLETFKGKKSEVVERTHGYSAGKIDLLGSKGLLTFWPRVLGQVQGGQWKMIPDHTYDLVFSNVHTKPVEISLLRPHDGNGHTGDLGLLPTELAREVTNIRKALLVAKAPELHQLIDRVEEVQARFPKGPGRHEIQQLRGQISDAIARERSLKRFRRTEIRVEGAS